MRFSLFTALLLALTAGLWAQTIPELTFGPDQERIRIESLEGMVRYDEDANLMYARERVRITQIDTDGKEQSIEADSIIFDPLTKEAQAYGNVILEGPEMYFEADSVWYNFRSHEGIGHNVTGWDGDVHMQGAEFRRLSQEEILFRRAPSNWNTLDTEAPMLVTPHYTTCDFPEPHTAVRAREFDLYNDDRVFARHVAIEVLGTPVFYLPFWTRNLGQDLPWDTRFGYSSLLGAFFSLDYNYRHRMVEPDPFTGEMRMRSSGHARVGVDYYTRRGFGYGAEYTYRFGNDAHRGRWQVYFIEDRGRDDDNRWLVEGQHRWKISEELVALIGADLVNDPEMYEDFFENFDIADTRGRAATRRIFGSLTYTDDDFISRMSADWRQRLSEDRVTNFSEPTDDNDDFEFDSDGDGEDDLDRRFDEDRYQTQSERFEYAFATNQLQIGNLPLFYSSDLTLFTNLDPGLNRNSTRDDSRVNGIDFYQSVLWSIQITDRISLLVRGGLGVAGADRGDDSFHISGPYPRRVNNVIFTDEGAFYVGTDMVGNDGLNDAVLDGTEGAFSSDTLDLNDVDTFWVYGDALVRLQARLSDALTAYAEWRYRESSGQNLGEFYAEAGNQTFLEDLYAFRLEEHWIEAGLIHRLRRPDIQSYIIYEYNLQGSSDIYQGERLQRLSAGSTWTNAKRTIVVSLHGDLTETQLRHPSDVREVQIFTASGILEVTLQPRHGIWYDQMRLAAFVPLEDDPFPGYDNTTDDDDLDEDDEVITLSNTLGVKVSPLWDMVWQVRLTDDSNDGSNAGTSVALRRDLHDAVLIIGLSAENQSYRGQGSSSANRIDATVAINFKGASEEPIGVTIPALIIPTRRPSEIDEGV